MNYISIVSTIQLKNLLNWRSKSDLLVLATGCFDIFHNGHRRLLEEAKKLGDYLLVGINSDQSVKALKGPSRPINNQTDRAEVLVALRCVDTVTIYEDTADFLTLVKPDIWVKGGDYTLETLDQNERAIVESYGGKIVFIPLVDGLSSTKILQSLDK